MSNELVGSVPGCPVGAAVPPPRRPLARGEPPRPDPAEVADFLEQHAAAAGLAELDRRARLDEVRAQLAETGSYTHTRAELTFGAKQAWRNHTRCVGKLYWRSLVVRDCRRLSHPTELRDALFEHLRWAANGGRIRPTISVFAPDGRSGPGPRLHNRQLVGYAGHREPDGTVLGDPAAADLTELAARCGWAPAERGRFDLLPLLIETTDGRVTAHDLAPELAFEVPIRHPDRPGLAALGLRWYGFPTVSDMTLLIGGIRYPMAPFTGWYVAPEVSARDLTDPHRYNLLPDIAAGLGLPTGADRTLWRDRALVELTAAVLWSYDQAGIRIDDHHAATGRFHQYTLAEQRRGRDVEADWAWLIPPISASATPVFHQQYSNRELRPNFVRDRSPDGG
jgi:nitric-oxide synthase